MSLSKKHEAGIILNEAHFFACQNRKLLIHSMERCPTEQFFSLNLSSQTMLIFGEPESCMPSGATVVPIHSWVQFSIFMKKIVFPIDLLVLSRVDTWDLKMTKKRRGLLRKSILSYLTPSRMKGTTVVITSMGRDEGLKERVDESIFIG